MDDYLIRILVKVGIVALGLGLLWLWGYWRATGLSRRAMRCVEAGDTVALSALLEKNHQAVEEMEMRAILLFYAVTLDKVDVIRTLLAGQDAAKLQAQAEAQDFNLLNLAVEHAAPGVLRTLLAAGMKPGAEKHSPWLQSCADGKLQHARVLAEYGADKLSEAQLEEEGGKSAMHVMVYGSFAHPEACEPMLHYLLERGEDVNAMTPCGNTPLDLACDETHVGSNEGASMAQLLEAVGGKHGACLRVPHPHYTARVFVKGALPEWEALTLPEGVVITPCTEAYKDSYFESFSRDYMKEAVREALRSHTAYLEISAQGAEGELPVKVAHRAFAVANRLSGLPGVVGVQFGRQIAPGFSTQASDGEPMPLDLVAVHAAGPSDGSVVVVYTDGMADYGLQEYTVVVPAVACRRKGVNPYVAILTLMEMAMTGVMCAEPGHTMTLEGVFARVSWGTHPGTQKPGFIVTLSGDETPSQYLRPHYKTPEAE